jgi:hypothetical protein
VQIHNHHKPVTWKDFMPGSDLNIPELRTDCATVVSVEEEVTNMIYILR